MFFNRFVSDVILLKKVTVDLNQVSAIRARYQQVREIINSAALKVGRSPESIRLVVVTKTHSLSTVRSAVEAGICDLGENYAEEAVEKIEAIGAITGLKWHMIGHVQSRKAALVAKNFDFVHSLDSLKLASRLDRCAGEVGHKIPVLLECNVGGETSKFGFSAFNHAQWEVLSAAAWQIAQLPNLEIRGLMTMPPFHLDAEKTRPYFQKMRELQEFLSKLIPHTRWDELSMGTSSDFAVAVEEGATLVRVGTAILGSRPPRE
jgi:pyridoxal phosphate enzyme (YggS family)